MPGELLTMSQKELNKLEIVQKVSDRRLKQREAGELLGLSTRQIKRLVRDYRRGGAQTLVSKQRGKRSNRQHKPELKNEVMSLVIEHYFDFGPKFAAEKLLERHQLKINRETLRQWMIESNLWKGKCRKTGPIHQQRKRRSCLGELVQIDGSHHAWFEERGAKCCLLVFIDDATSRILELRFEEQETTVGYFNAIRSYLKRHGRPVSFYSDKHGIFRVNAVEAERGSGETQFGRAMRELGIEVIFANTPEAKGRVERANATLQDRLVKELRLRGINDIEAGNKFLAEYMLEHNKRFSNDAADPKDLHQKTIPTDAELDLIFSFQYERTLSKNLEISYQNVIYQIKTESHGYGLRGAKIKVCDDQCGCVTLLYQGRLLRYTKLDKKNRVAEPIDRKSLHTVLDQKIKADGRSKGNKPQANHPWKQYVLVAKRKEAYVAKEKTRLPTNSTSSAGVT